MVHKILHDLIPDLFSCFTWSFQAPTPSSRLNLHISNSDCIFSKFKRNYLHTFVSPDTFAQYTLFLSHLANSYLFFETQVKWS